MKREKAISPSATWETVDFYKPKQTKDNPSGYKGRVGIYEVLEISDTIKDMILKKADFMEIERAAKKNGMVTMVEDAFCKAALGYTSLEEILRVATE